MDGFVFILLLAAVALGFGVGYWRGRDLKVKGHAQPAIQKRYVEGLNHLLNEQPDAAIETFVSLLDVNGDTLETHFALGSLLRRRGEVDRAIRIHQNLLARSSLSAGHMEQAQLALGLDYQKSGLLDRAEALFRELTRSSDITVRKEVLQRLVEIYQDEQEWEYAIETIDALCAKKLKSDSRSWRHVQAHYCCELNEQYDREGVNALAQRWLDKAFAFERECARATLISSRAALQEGNAVLALNHLSTLSLKEPYLLEWLPLMTECHEQLGIQRSLDDRLVEVYQQLGSPALIPSIADGLYQQEGDNSALEFIQQELQAQPQMQSFARLLGIVDLDHLTYPAIKPIVHDALPLTFCCEACGFEGQQLYWCCPTCKTWL